MQYVPVDGELEVLPGIRLLATPRHTPGSQVVVVETAGRPVVIGGDTAIFFGEAAVECNDPLPHARSTRQIELAHRTLPAADPATLSVGRLLVAGDRDHVASESHGARDAELGHT